MQAQLILDGWVNTDQFFSGMPIFRKGERRIMFDKKNDKIYREY